MEGCLWSYVEKRSLVCRTRLFYEHVKYVLSVSLSLCRDHWRVFFKSAHFNEFKEHYKDLVAFIAKAYLIIRMNYEENKRSTVDKYVRHFHTKIVLFKHQ